MIKSVLTKDLQKKQILMNSYSIVKKQVEAIHNNDSYLFCTWMKEARLARRNWQHYIVRKKSMMRNVHVFKGL